MSWAKAPRILLVWPKHQGVALGPLDLRILQQRALELGAQLGLVTTHAIVRRDARSFGIPVFRSTSDAQRVAWESPPGGRLRRGPRLASRVAQLIALRQQLSPKGTSWIDHPALRIGIFSTAVIAVFGLASLFVPRAEIVLSPVSRAQSAVLDIGEGTGTVGGTLVPQALDVSVSGNASSRIQSQVLLPAAAALGRVRFQNRGDTSSLIPVGTVVYSTSESPARFATLDEAELEAGEKAFADVRIQAIDPGTLGNVGVGKIQGIEGNLGATVTVTNLVPTSGGSETLASVPSQADRDQLRERLLRDLAARAESMVGERVDSENAVLPGSVTLLSVAQEIFDPAPGRPASLLILQITAKYRAKYVRMAQLEFLARATLDDELPPGFAERPGTLQVRLNSLGAGTSDGRSRYELEMDRIIMRAIDPEAVKLMIRGRRQALADEIMAADLPLTVPPLIRLSPSWWPWLPLIPFRIAVLIS